MPRSIAAVLLVIALAACGGSSTSREETVDLRVDDGLTTGSYELVIGRPAGAEQSYNRILKGERVNTNWEESAGLIYLGADDDLEPLGTLTMTIAPPFQDPSGTWVATIRSAVLSITDRRVGTGPELNARAYEILPSEENGLGLGNVSSLQIGNNFVKGSIDMVMQRTLIPSTQIPDVVQVTGDFVAIE